MHAHTCTHTNTKEQCAHGHTDITPRHHLTTHRHVEAALRSSTESQVSALTDTQASSMTQEELAGYLDLSLKTTSRLTVMQEMLQNK